MLKINDLTLIGGSAIYLKDFDIEVHQPTIEEIAHIGGEQVLYQSLSIFSFDSSPLEEYLSSLDLSNNELEILKLDIKPYDVFLFVLQVYTTQGYEEEAEYLMGITEKLFGLLFPSYKFNYNKEDNHLILAGKEDDDYIVIDRDLFDIIEDITDQIFLTDVFLAKSDTSNMSEEAKAIAEKMKKAEEKIKEMSDDEEGEDSQFALMISILGVSHHIDYLNSLTVYQLYNQFTRHNLKEQFEQVQRSAMFGGKQEVVNWYKKI